MEKLPLDIDKIKQAEVFLQEYMQNESLLKHSWQVASCMYWYAEHYEAEDPTSWVITGLLHDFDYEKYPDQHPQIGQKFLEDAGYNAEIVRAIQSHANFTGVKRESLMEKVLYAVDELSGFINACSLVRPDKNIAQVQVKSVRKKMKSKGFAAGCNREEMTEGAAELGVELNEHIQNLITAMGEDSLKTLL